MRAILAVLFLLLGVHGAAGAQAPMAQRKASWMHPASRCASLATTAAECRAGALWGSAPGGVAASAPADASRGRALEREGRSHVLAGAAVGLLVGAGVTYAVLHSGGSTSLCDQSANQDAMAPRECAGLTALGGLAGAGVGAVIGARIRTGRREACSGECRRAAPTLAVAF
jgi:hypothetical protein